jgi:type I restriction enzyme S subunit
MELKPDYKRTEVGVIPKDWDAPLLGELFTFKNGLTKAKRFFGYGTPIVNYMDVYGKRGLHAHDLLGRVSLSKQEIRTFEVRKGDVFFTRTSETSEEVGITSVMLDDAEDTVFSGFIVRARPRNESIDDQFKKYCFSISAVRRQITSQSTETTRALTNGRYLSAVAIARPPLAEQRAIAKSLGDVDELIGALDKLIAKKRDLKQAAMQHLLTGTTRLPGFSGKWEVKKLGDVCGVITTGKLDANAMVPNGEYPFFTCAEGHYWIDKYAFDNESLLVSGNGANVGYVHYYKGKCNAYQRTYVLTGFSENIEFHCCPVKLQGAGCK